MNTSTPGQASPQRKQQSSKTSRLASNNKHTTRHTTKPTGIALKETYYADNFNYLIDFVADHYQALLTSEESNFFRLYKKLSVNAQRLFARLVLRTPAFLRVSKIAYTEIDVPEALEELAQSGFIKRDAHAIEHCLPLFTQQELSAALGTTGHALPETNSTSWNTADLFGDSPASKLFATDSVIEVNFKTTMLTFRLLFFGNLHQNFSSFVLRDLGYQRFEPYKIDREYHLFKTREQIEAHLTYYECSENYDNARESGIDALIALHNALPTPIETDNALCRKLDRLNNKIARQLERESACDDAAAIYKKTRLPPARERLARLYTKSGQTALALSLCQQIIQSPLDSDELDFALSFGQKVAAKANQPFPPQEKYHPPESGLTLPKSQLSVEFAVALHLAKTGKCYYLENNLISGMFGLAFWDIIFAPLSGAFFHPFQSRPADFYEPDFVTARKELITQRLTDIAEGKLVHLVNHHLYHKRHNQNPLVNWHMCRKHILDLALKRIPSETWSALFSCMLTDIRNYRSGQPDLVWFPDQGGYQFIEVKAPGDKIQKNQLRWMKLFNQHNVPHLVINVEWQDSSNEAN